MTPRATPIAPPITVSVTASREIASLMSFLLAPMALRRPISRVRSVTVVSIMFMMPMPPTTSDMPATAAKRMVKVPVTLEAAERYRLG